MKSDPAWLLVVVTLSAFGATACGGATFTSAGGDASAPVDDGGADGSADGSADATKGEAAPPPEASATDVVVSCTTGIGSGGGGINGTCTRNQDYTCGAATYEIDCSCPADKCACKVNGVVAKAITYGGCANCSKDPIDLAAACGFPAP